MRIGVHLESLRPGRIGGMELYVRQLLDAALEHDPEVSFVLAGAPYNAATFTPGPRLEVRTLEPEDFRRLDAAALGGWGLDLWFCPLLTLEPPQPGLPSVVTIPDLQHETLPHCFSEEILSWRREHYPRSAGDAGHVLTLSHFSRREIVDRLQVPAEKVTAIHLAAAPGFARAARDASLRRAVRRRHRLPSRYLFYPANSWPHKNHRTLFAALARIKRRRGACPPLVLCGAAIDGGGWSAELARLGLEDDVRILGYVDAAELPALYAEADLLVFPSGFEGFGIPLVEAMLAGCPVLASNATSLPEVGGEAARYFDPSSTAELATEIEALWNDDGARRALAAAGRRRGRTFSWRRTAAAALAVFRRLLAADRPPITAAEVPPITVITPSFEQAPFIARTLDSVLTQGHPRLKLWVIDGGSTDGTVEILERYRRRHPGVVDFVSEGDRGQAHALNKGLRRADPEGIIGWLNADDVYFPGALERVAGAFCDHPGHGWLYGRARYLDAADGDLGPYPTRASFDWHALAHECYLCQPAVFWWPARLGRVYDLDENLQTCMDFDLWIRIGRHHPPLFVDAELAGSRIHRGMKTIARRGRVFAEIIGTVKRHYGYVPLSWAAGKAQHICQPEVDPFRPPPRVPARTLAVAALLVLRYNWSSPSYLPRAAAELRRLVFGDRRESARRDECPRA